MKRSAALAAGVLAVLVAAAPASAGPLYRGTTSLQGAAVAGTTLSVDVTITSAGPVVPFEFQVQNECQLPSRGGRTIQNDDIVYWTDDVDGIPHAVVPVYLQSIPAGSKCKVFLMRSTVQVKGSVSSYTVLAAP